MSELMVDSRIVHEIIKTPVAKPSFDVCKARLDTLRIIDHQAESLDADLGQVGNVGRLSGRGQHAQSIPMELARKGVPDSAGGTPVVISRRSRYLALAVLTL